MWICKLLSAVLFVLITESVVAQTDDGSITRGKMVYEQNCLACHQADGSGVPALAPPLIKGTFVGGDTAKLIEIILDGMQGVEINGEYYANPMPAFSFLSDQEIADVLTYVRNSFSNNAGEVTKEEVTQARNEKK